MNEYASVTAPDTVCIERLLPGPMDRIWSYLTDAELRRQWFCGGHMQGRVGGKVELIFRNSDLAEGDDPPPGKYAKYAGETRSYGSITAWDPPTLLAYTWGESDGEESEVRFEMSEQGKHVRLVITHRRLKTREARISVASGWHAHLDILLSVIKGQEPGGFWRHHTQLEVEYEKRID